MASVNGGDKLEAALRELSESISKPSHLRVGFLENATYPDGTQVAAVAIYNNYGTKNSPARPFFTNMVHDKSPGWGKALGVLLKANDYDATRTMELAGQAIKEQLQQSIKDTNSPPLAESTIEAKGFDKPLIHTGHMLNSVAFEVK